MSDADTTMTLAESVITLHDLRLHAFHGVLPQERIVGGDYRVTLRVAYDVSRAMETDDVAVPSALLEHVAGRIGKAVFQRFPQVTAVDVEVVKCNPPMGVQCGGASVLLHLINNKTNG